MKKNLKTGLIVASVVAVGLILGFKLKKRPTVSVPTGGGSSGGGGRVSSNPDLDFRSLANQLFDSFDGYGTANQKVKDIFKLLKSNADYDALKAAYGVREINSGWGNIFVGNFEGDLPSTIKDEMSEAEVAELNQILTSNGISRTI